MEPAAGDNAADHPAPPPGTAPGPARSDSVVITTAMLGSIAVMLELWGDFLTHVSGMEIFAIPTWSLFVAMWLIGRWAAKDSAGLRWTVIAVSLLNIVAHYAALDDYFVFMAYSSWSCASTFVGPIYLELVCCALFVYLGNKKTRKRINNRYLANRAE